MGDVTGTLLQGGRDVLISPYQRHYLTFEMEDRDIAEYRRSGELPWTGITALTSNDGDLVGTFQNMHRAAPHRVQATAVPYDGSKSFLMALALRGDGKFGYHCPHNSMVFPSVPVARQGNEAVQNRHRATM